MKYTLLASSFEFGPTGIQKLISQYYFGSTVILNLISENEWSISNSKGLIENVRVVKKGSRYRFERKEN